MRRLSAAMALVGLIGTSVGVPAAAEPVRPGEPVLKPDTMWNETDWGYIRDGVALPEARPDGKPWPAVLYMEGYGGAGVPNAYLRMDDGELMALHITFGNDVPPRIKPPRRDYAYIRASIRGTECSGGSFNLYDRRHAWDGHHIIEWIADQPWSNGKVGMIGGSFPGQTAYWTATTKPPALKAVSANLLHSDIYRDIFMPGGVQNNLFPIAWTYGGVLGPHRTPNDRTLDGWITQDEICAYNQASRYGPGDTPQPHLEPALAVTSPTDNSWYAAHAASTYADSIKIPFYMQVNWQDEQVGARSAVLFRSIDPDPVEITDSHGQRVTIIPKKLVTSSGSHGHGWFYEQHSFDWFDIFLQDMPDVQGIMDAPVTNYFETRPWSGDTWTATKSGSDWPYPDTDWTRLYAHGDGILDGELPVAEEPTASYLSGVARQNWFQYTGTMTSAANTIQGLPDAVAWESAPLEDDLVIAGPLMFDLYASMAGTDADFFVSISEVFPDGRVSYLQRGLLKASHNRIDPKRAIYAGDGTMVMPYRPHTNPQPVVPGEVVHYPIEFIPLGHIFRTDSRIRIQLHTPPVVDGLWGYTPTHHQPAVVTVHSGPQTPTSLLLPVVQPDGPLGPRPADCKVPGGFPCFDPSPLG
jgi:uncharacterized protein